MRDIDLIVIHCADTPNGKHFGVEEIDEWHHERGFLRREDDRRRFNPNLEHIGYHAVVYVDGTVVTGRGIDEVGAHAEGYNARSIGVCMVGRDKFTPLQWSSLKKWLEVRKAEFPDAAIKGHYQVNAKGKTCPNFDVPGYVSRGMQPDTDDIYVRTV